VKKNTKPEKLGKVARDNAFELQTLAAQGMDNAAVELYKTAHFATYALTVLSHQIPCRQSDVLAAIAQRKTSWPVLYSPHSGLKKRADELIERLQVGPKTSLNVWQKKGFGWERPANQVAIYLLQLVSALQRAPVSQWDEQESYLCAFIGRFYIWPLGGGAITYTRERDEEQLHALETWAQTGPGRQLPPLSKSTAKAWAKATPEFFRLVFGKTFDQHPNLQTLKEWVVGHARTWDGRTGGPGIIRAAMLRKVQQAWKSIAVGPNTR
jgi:hypothetical protein